MEVSENNTVSVSVKEEFKIELLHTPHIGTNTPVFTVSPLINNPCEPVDAASKSAALTISACLLSTNPSIDSLKTAPFYPRVLVGAQSSASSADAPQTVLSESDRYLQSQLPFPSFTNQTTSITSTQLFPLILTATPTNSTSSPPTSNAYAPIHVQVNNASGSTTTVANNSDCSPTIVSSPGKVINTMPPSTSSALTSTPTCTISRGSNSTSGNVTSVVIAPHLGSSIQPAFTLRFTPNPSIQCSSLASAGSNSLLLETPVVTSHLTSAPTQQSNTSTLSLNASNVDNVSLSTSQTPLTSTCTPPSVSLLMSSGLCPAPRVLIHKSTGLTTLNQGLSSGAALSESFPLTLVTGPVRADETARATLNICPATTSNSDLSTSGCVIASHSPLNTPTKAKLVSLAPPVSANVRLFTPNSTTVPHATTNTSSTGTYAASVTNAFSSTTVHPVVSPMKAGCTGLWTNLSSSNGVLPSSLVALQSPQPLLVHTTSDVVPLSSTGSVSSSQASGNSTRPLASVAPGHNSHTTVPLSLSLNVPTAPSTVLAFSLSTTTPPSINVSGGTILPPTATTIKHGGMINPLIVRGSSSSAVVNTTNSGNPITSVAPLTNASLLKPFSLSIPGGVSATQSYLYTSVHSPVVSPSGAAVPQVVPINIAPARASTVSTGLTASSSVPSVSTSSIRSQLHSAISSCILSPRHNLSVFSPSNRKRARKQQLAVSSSVTTTTASVPTTGFAVIPNCGPITISPTTGSTTNAPATLTAVPFCSTGSPISIAHFTPMAGRSGHTVTPTIVAIPKPILQPVPLANQSSLPIQSLSSLPPKPGVSSTIDSSQTKTPNTSFTSSLCVTTSACLGALANTMSAVAPTTTCTPSGYVGIRLLSVRPSATNLTQSSSTSLMTNTTQLSALPNNVSGLITRLGTGTAVGYTSECTPTTGSATCGSGTHLRLAPCTTTVEASHTQSTTVYVLTTSNAYPVLSCASSLTSVPTVVTNTSETLHGSISLPATVGSIATIATTSSSHGTAVMMPGTSSGVVQVRFRPPLTSTSATAAITSTLASSNVTSNSCSSAVLGAISTTAAVTIASPLVLDTVCTTRFSYLTPGLNQTGACDSVINKISSTCTQETVSSKPTSLRPSTSFTSSSSLLHRHLLSPQNPIHIEHNTTDVDDQVAESSGDLDNPAVANLIELSTASAASDDIPTYVPSASLRYPEGELHYMGRLKHGAYGNRTGEAHVRITAAADMATEGMTRLDDEDEDEEDLKVFDDNKLKVSDIPRLPRKRLKLDENMKCADQHISNSQHAGTLDDEQLLLLLKSKAFDGRYWSNPVNAKPSASMDPTVSNSTNVHIAIDPVSSCEWIVTGWPTKPSIIPRWMCPTGRLSNTWRTKSTHFLSSSEVRIKPEGKWVGSRRVRQHVPSQLTYPDDGSFTDCTTRRHRRLLSRQTLLDRASEDGSVHSCYSKRLGFMLNSTDRRLLRDIMALRGQQSELQFLHFPLTHTSVLNITGWRMLSCTDNLDLLVFSEYRSLQSMNSLYITLQDCSRQLLGSKRLPVLTQSNLHSTQHCQTCEFHGSMYSSNSPKLPSSNDVPPAAEISISSRNRPKTAADYVATQIEKAFDLILGICQRKQHLMDSLQRLHSRSRRLVEQFGTEALSLFDDMEREYEEQDRETGKRHNPSLDSHNNNCTDACPPSPFPSTSTKASVALNNTKVANEDTSHAIPPHARRSTRASSPGRRNPLKRFRRRDATHYGSNSLRANSSKNGNESGCSVKSSSTKLTVLCNGEASSSHCSRR